MKIEMSADWTSTHVAGTNRAASRLVIGPYEAMVFENQIADSDELYIRVTVVHLGEKVYEGSLYKMYTFKEGQAVAEGVINKHHLFLHPELKKNVRGSTEMPGVLINSDPVVSYIEQHEKFKNRGYNQR